MPDRIIVSSADFIRNVGRWQSEALQHPISITHHGRERLVLVSSARFAEAMTRPDAPESDALVELRQQHNWLLDNMEEGHVLLDRGLKIVRLNAAAAAMLRISDAVMGRDFETMLPNTAATAMRDAFKSLLHTGKAVAMECDPDHFDGRSLVIHAALSFPYVVLRITDETAHTKNARTESVLAALRIALQEMHVFAEIHVSPFGRVIDASDRFLELTQFAPEDIAGARLVDLLSVQDRRKLPDALERVVTTRSPEMISANFLCRNGGARSSQVSISPIADEGVLLVVQFIEQQNSSAA